MTFLLRRLGFYAVAAWAAITINFVIPHLLPSNPVQVMMARHPEFPPSARRALEIQFGLGHQGSLLHQYWVYLGHLFQGNLGISVLNYPATVATVLNNTWPWTIALVGSATIISFVIGTLLGIFAGWRRDGWFDRALPAFAFLQASPQFVLGGLLLVLFSADLHLVPAFGGYTLGDTIGFNGTFVSSAINHSLLPAAVIIVTSMAGWMLQMRNVMITTTGEDYVLAAQAKGLSTRRIMFTYAARNAILPNIAGFALSIGFVIAGALVMEIVFSYPGVGYQLYQAVTNDDFPVMQGIFLAISATVLLACLLADLLYVLADPRVRTRAAY